MNWSHRDLRGAAQREAAWGWPQEMGLFSLEHIFPKPNTPTKCQMTGQGAKGLSGPLDRSGDSEKASCRSWHWS